MWFLLIRRKLMVIGGVLREVMCSVLEKKQVPSRYLDVTKICMTD